MTFRLLRQSAHSSVAPHQTLRNRMVLTQFSFEVDIQLETKNIMTTLMWQLHNI